MFIATAASLYSSSPPPSLPPPPSHTSAPHSSTASPPLEIEFHPRVPHSCHHHHPPSRPVVGGLSSIFGSPSSRYSPCSTSDASSIDGSSLSRRSSQADLSALLDSCDSRSDSSSLRERSPITSLHGPASFGGTHNSSSRPNRERGAMHSSSTSRIVISSTPVRERNEQILVLDGDIDLYYLNQGSTTSFLGGFEIPSTDIYPKPETPRLTRTSCSSISELFCKPLLADAPCSSVGILEKAQNENEIFKDPLVIQAFKFAAESHDGQLRANGDPYLVHCLEAAKILASIGANKVVVAAGLLHDTIDDSSVKYSELEEQFGSEVADLVKGVTKLSEFSKLARDNNTAYKSVEADRLHTMMLAMADVRIVLIKLADRLHNMRTLGALRKDKRDRIAKETLEVFVPLAGRLGIWSWKAEIEDLCFKHLQYDNYRKLSNRLAEGSRERTILSAIETLDEKLVAHGVKCLDLSGRPKNLYSIHKKMLQKGRKVEEIYDARGLRLIVPNVADCYAALDVVHQTWTVVPGKQKDYINQPKLNGYQSLHTVVLGDDGLPVEIQIRTMEMHYQAEFGVAAHWRYKEGDVPHSSFILQMVEWARWVLTWQNEIMDTKLRVSRGETELRPPCSFPFHDEACPYLDMSYGPPCNPDNPLFVIVVEENKMRVQELPGNSTVADLLDRMIDDDPVIATGFWEDSKPKVNHTEVEDIQQKLQMGDLIEVVPQTSLNDYREKLMRMYSGFSVRDPKFKSRPSTVGLSKVAVF